MAASSYEMLNKQDKIWDDTSSAYLVKFFTAIVLLIALSSLMYMSSACLGGRPLGQPGDYKMGGAKLRISPRGEGI